MFAGQAVDRIKQLFSTGSSKREIARQLKIGRASGAEAPRDVIGSFRKPDSTVRLEGGADRAYFVRHGTAGPCELLPRRMWYVRVRARVESAYVTAHGLTNN